MSAMTDQGNDKDALLEKLDGLIQSGRARRRRDPPPVLTDAIPTASESEIPTLTDAVEVPETSHADQVPEPSGEQPEQTSASATVDLDTPLEFEPATADTPEPGTPAEPATTPGHRQATPDNIEPDTPAELQASISSRLVAVIEREMAALIEQFPAHESKLAVLQRSLRFALPELVRLRLEEHPVRKPSDDDSNDATDTDSSATES